MAVRLPSNPIARFGLEAVAWMPVAFFAWYGLIDEIGWVVARLSGLLFGVLLPLTVEKVLGAGRELLVVTTYHLAQQASQVVAVKVPVGALGYGLPLFVALALTPSMGAWALSWRMAVGVVTTLAVQIWGAWISVLSYIRLDQHLPLRELPQMPVFADQAIYVVHAFSYLILPALVPVLLWLALFRVPLQALLKGPARPDGCPPVSEGQSGPG